MDQETVGDVMWSWEEHERSAGRKGDLHFYERINKDAVVHGAVGNAQDLAAFRKGRGSPDPKPPQRSRPTRTRPAAGRQSRPHSPFTGVIANRPGDEMETETAARYAEYAEQDAKHQQPLRCKSTKSARMKAGERRTPETSEYNEQSEHSGRWTMSRFKNVPSHFEQDRALLGKAASVPNLPRQDRPQPIALAGVNTSCASRSTASRQLSMSGAVAGSAHEFVASGAGLKWPRKSSSAIEPKATVASHAGTGIELVSELASEFPGELSSDVHSRVSASFVSGAMTSGIGRVSSTLAPSACPAAGVARNQSRKNGPQISASGSRMPQASMPAPGPPDMSLCSSSVVAHAVPRASATVRKSRAASAPARGREAAICAVGASTPAVSKPGGVPSRLASAPSRPRTANPKTKSIVSSEPKIATGTQRPSSSNPHGRPELSVSVGADAAAVSAIPPMKVAELDASFVSDLWARHRPYMRGKEVVNALRCRPHSASA